MTRPRTKRSTAGKKKNRSDLFSTPSKIKEETSENTNEASASPILEEESSTPMQKHNRRSFLDHCMLLKMYKHKHGHTNIPRCDTEDPVLARWCYEMRRTYRVLGTDVKTKYYLNEERISTLRDIGFDFNWNDELVVREMRKKRKEEKRELKEKAKKKQRELNKSMSRDDRKSTNVDSPSPVDHELLSPTSSPDQEESPEVVTSGRGRSLGRRSSSISEKEREKDRERKRYKTKYTAFEDHFQNLCDFKEKHGHYNVPENYHDQKFSKWVRSMRQTKRYQDEGKSVRYHLTNERKKALDSIGFNWINEEEEVKSRPARKRKAKDQPSPEETKKAKVEKKKEPKKEVVKVEVKEEVKPEPVIENPPKAARASGRERKKRKLDQVEDVTKTLPTRKKIGTRLMISFEEQCHKLKVYKEQHGDCDVPPSFGDSNFVKWIESMRQSYRYINEGKKPRYNLSKDRIDALNKLGFCWTSRSENDSSGSVSSLTDSSNSVLSTVPSSPPKDEKKKPQKIKIHMSMSDKKN